MDTNDDYLIIGSGAGGSAAAYHLVQSGRRVRLLERGEALPDDGSTLDVDQVIVAGRFKSREIWRDRQGAEFAPEEYFNVGGKTMWYGAALLRFSPQEFSGDNERQCRAWPISYDELAPYYDAAERLLRVRRFAIEPDLSRLIDRMRRRDPDWRTVLLPLALSEDILKYPEEARHFDGFASARGLKADAQHALLAHLRQRSNFQLVTGEQVVRLLGAEGAPQRLIGAATARGHTYRARHVILAAGALHSPRLLQRYLETSDLARQLPCYASVGRHFKRHLLTVVLAVTPARQTDVLRKTVLLLNERFPFSSVQPVGFDAEIVAKLMPRFIPAWFARAFGARSYGFFLQTEEGSSAENRVIAPRIDSAPPALDYDAERTPRALREHRAFVRAFRAGLLGARYLGFARTIPLAGTAHACGTLIAGDDPANSVVDAQGRVHGLENLYVVDGSVLPRVSRVNPSLTIYAWALRVAHLLENKGDTNETGVTRVHSLRT